MGLLSNLANEQTTNVKAPTDTVGTDYSTKPSGVYTATVKLAYLSKSSKGSLALNVVLDIEGKEYKETMYITGADGKNTYVSKTDNSINFLPSYITANDIALLTTHKELNKSTATESKIIKIWNYEQKKEVPTEVECITSMHGQKIKVGILEQKEFKKVKQGNEYVPTDETKLSNVINKVFHAVNNKTVNECKAKVEQAEFMDKWIEKYSGNLIDKTTKTGSNKSTSPVKPTAESNSAFDMFN